MVILVFLRKCFAEFSGYTWTAGEEDRMDAEDTLRIRAIPERLICADPVVAEASSPMSNGLPAREPAVNEELPLNARPC